MKHTADGFGIEFTIGRSFFQQNFIGPQGALELTDALDNLGVKYKIRQGTYTYHVGLDLLSGYISKNSLASLCKPTS